LSVGVYLITLKQYIKKLYSGELKEFSVYIILYVILVIAHNEV